MFIDQESKNDLEQEDDYQSKHLHQKTIIFSVVLIILILSLSFLFWWWQKSKIPTSSHKIFNKQPATTSPAILPKDLPGNGYNNKKNLNEENDLSKISYAQFYKKPVLGFKIKSLQYQMPLEVKKDTLNFYDANRKINLDNNIKQLNNNGFTYLPNEVKDNFFSSYDYLRQKDLPLLLTSDYLLYYYQK